ncbi:MAG: PilZ domain-containing protein [Defluviitaleaceae bacterium]|nr:PilZ domain-containing protein [Defluviitaleaceae bacterium]
MNLKFVDPGSPMHLVPIVDGKPNEDSPKIDVAFVDCEGNALHFHIESKELFTDFADNWQGKLFMFTFYRDAYEYTFWGKLERAATVDGHDYVYASVASFIEQKSRRRSLRVELLINITLYKMDPDAPNRLGPLVGAGVMLDISEGGLCFLSNENFKLDKEQDYIVSFAISSLNTFYMHVMIVRVSDSTQSFQYRYEYAFRYGNTTDKKEIHELAYAMLQSKI